MTNKSYGVRGLVAAAAFSLIGGMASAQLATDTCDFGTIHAFPYSDTGNHNGYASNWIAAFGGANNGGDAFYEFNLAANAGVRIGVTAGAAMTVFSGLIIDCPVAGANLVTGSAFTATTNFRRRFALPAGFYGHFFGPQSNANNNNTFTASGHSNAAANTNRAGAVAIPSPGNGNAYNYSNAADHAGVFVQDVNWQGFWADTSYTSPQTFYSLTPVSGTGGNFTCTCAISSADGGNEDAVLVIYQGAPGSVPASIAAADPLVVASADDFFTIGDPAESATVALTEGQPYTIICGGWSYATSFGTATMTLTSVNVASVSDWSFME